MLSLHVINNRNLVLCNKWWLRLKGLYFQKPYIKCLIYPCKCIHTFMFWRNIDVAFCNKKRKVIKVILNLKPGHICFCKDSFYVLERFSKDDDSFVKKGEYIYW